MRSLALICWIWRWIRYSERNRKLPRIMLVGAWAPAEKSPVGPWWRLEGRRDFSPPAQAGLCIRNGPPQPPAMANGCGPQPRATIAARKTTARLGRSPASAQPASMASANGLYWSVGGTPPKTPGGAGSQLPTYLAVSIQPSSIELKNPCTGAEQAHLRHRRAQPDGAGLYPEAKWQPARTAALTARRLALGARFKTGGWARTEMFEAGWRARVPLRCAPPWAADGSASFFGRKAKHEGGPGKFSFV